MLENSQCSYLFLQRLITATGKTGSSFPVGTGTVSHQWILLCSCLVEESARYYRKFYLQMGTCRLWSNHLLTSLIRKINWPCYISYVIHMGRITTLFFFNLQVSFWNIDRICSFLSNYSLLLLVIPFIIHPKGCSNSLLWWLIFSWLSMRSHVRLPSSLISWMQFFILCVTYICFIAFAILEYQ